MDHPLSTDPTAEQPLDLAFSRVDLGPRYHQEVDHSSPSTETRSLASFEAIPHFEAQPSMAPGVSSQAASCHVPIQQPTRRHGAQLRGQRTDYLDELQARQPSQALPLLDSRYGIQWRPNLSEDSEQRMTRILENAISKLAEAVRPTTPHHRRTVPTYKGTIWEDPRRFIEDISAYATMEGIPTTEWTRLAAEQLRGDAHSWYEDYRALDLSFATFHQYLEAKFNNLALRCRLQSQLYGQKQADEDATVFIHRKLALFRRLAPFTPEETMTQTVLELLAPTIRISLRGTQARSIEELTQLATAVEYDLQEQRRNRPLQPLNERPQNQRQVAVPKPNNSKPTGSPPYPCRACGEDHYHRDCPRRRAIEAPPPRGPGNSQGAAQ